MKFLVIGVGSMGKRRIRNLRALGYNDIACLDSDLPRLSTVSLEYSLPSYSDLSTALSEFEPSVFIISTSPEAHLYYAKIAVKNNIDCFIEASVIDQDGLLSLSNSLSKNSIIVLPSCTMKYYPYIIKLKEIISSGLLGSPLSMSYITGQYLPDWHPWESINDYYVGTKLTGGCRELVPFELTWIIDIFGLPTLNSSLKTKLSVMPADIDDFYSFSLAFESSLQANIVIEVLSRPVASRSLRIICTEGIIKYDGDDNTLKWISHSSPTWSEQCFVFDDCHPGYTNPESPYINELSDFISAVKHRDSSLFPNSLESDIFVLNLLNQIDQSSP